MLPDAEASTAVQNMPAGESADSASKAVLVDGPLQPNEHQQTAGHQKQVGSGTADKVLLLVITQISPQLSLDRCQSGTLTRPPSRHHWPGDQVCRHCHRQT